MRIAFAIACLGLCALPLHAQRMNLAGVANFARVTNQLYRGARPTALGLRNLAKLGVQVDVDLEAGSEPKREAPLAKAAGLYFLSLPWHALPWFFPPNKRDVKKLLFAMEWSPKAVYFVHCREGRDRTGIVVAAYRIEIDRWSPARAIREMDSFGFHGWLFPLWKRWLRGLDQ